MSRNRRRRIGVDLDGTLAHYEGWKGVEHIGDPIPEVADRVRRALAAGIDVWIYTARVAPHDTNGLILGHMDALAMHAVEEWCRRHFGGLLPVTCVKLREFDELWDDKTVGIRTNTGVGVPINAGSLWRTLGEP